ncbi:hypothetical protein D3OALGA1CA_3598 [Olavius algarvensis associated proteobacterium Delta 3]|nr:hypothetical protein D3OALGB2SA_2275 [Olavius algarvensis associated proteobacterium Delta 3]CAB5136845.1 hypothetical protein D3OALGA1CA_3598 [Olavius algarvensis associated proteobacterium Delta 3]
MVYSTHNDKYYQYENNVYHAPEFNNFVTLCFIFCFIGRNTYSNTEKGKNWTQNWRDQHE